VPLGHDPGPAGNAVAQRQRSGIDAKYVLKDIMNMYKKSVGVVAQQRRIQVFRMLL
jgi:hypothetical protein